ncbi:DUF485 domain-containing protein [Leptospira kmetyi]|uniref:DUF485 domain-containing protein n=1 Tax=Leptospira kmetyi TaxID=408139 RepID=A0ABX4NCZ3_9LEPT|nr:DUF485 domain-containing protein [Leptospira kmetyi]EQA54819.1 PF04341 family protein [Leptospira kmetyi serovar Malaysia str. Bejo-Iso9]PJZ31090.1 DUF485 domain-containing protein [Leptospira kmetyi]PJZ43534.1 DUF485 domain-containing protein [Leptospira kmetyi]TGL67873.1 DUF485 domain-containing protein [Leptospira kmetyi]
MKTPAHKLVDEPEFKKLVSTRWIVSFTLLALLFVSYYGYILTVAFYPELLVRKVGSFSNVGILASALVILFSWFLTLIYVVWANRSYDKNVNSLKRKLED